MLFIEPHTIKRFKFLQEITIISSQCPILVSQTEALLDFQQKSTLIKPYKVEIERDIERKIERGIALLLKSFHCKDIVIVWQSF